MVAYAYDNGKSDVNITFYKRETLKKQKKTRREFRHQAKRSENSEGKLKLNKFDKKRMENAVGEFKLNKFN